MKLQLFKALWGMEGTYEEQLSRASAGGYTGIEAPPPLPAQEDEFIALLERYGLQYIAQVFTGNDPVASFEEQVAYAARFKPIKIVSHSSRDCSADSEQDRFFAAALEAENRAGILIGHETHRHRAMFTPWTTARLLRKFPDLKITADFSHWMNVCESHLEDQADNLAIAMERAIHIHGRIGYPQGPQVAHPGAPEYRTELHIYTGWWKEILSLQASKGFPFATFTAEFGPPGYMHTLPYINVPFTDLWSVNQWMTDYFVDQFSLWETSERSRSGN